MKTFIRLLVLLFCAFFFFDCKISIEEEHLLPKITGEAASNSISVGIGKHSSSTDYINIYRKDLSTSQINNIGLILPKNEASDANVYIFQDEQVIKGNKYQYYARYHTDGEYYKSEWSNIVTAPSNAHDSSDKLAYTISSAHFTLDTSNYSLKMVDDVVNPDIPNFSTNFKPALIVKNNSTTKVFELSSLANGDIIPLRSILPPSFTGKPITVVGICGQHVEKTTGTNPQPKKVYWTIKTSIPVDGYPGNTFTVPAAKNSDGYDFS